MDLEIASSGRPAAGRCRGARAAGERLGAGVEQTTCRTCHSSVKVQCSVEAAAAAVAPREAAVCVSHARFFCCCNGSCRRSPCVAHLMVQRWVPPPSQLPSCSRLPAPPGSLPPRTRTDGPDPPKTHLYPFSLLHIPADCCCFQPSLPPPFECGGSNDWEDDLSTNECGGGPNDWEADLSTVCPGGTPGGIAPV